MTDARHQLAGAYADLSAARLAFTCGDIDDSLLILRSVANDVQKFCPHGQDEAFRHKKVTTLIDRLIRNLERR